MKKLKYLFVFLILSCNVFALNSKPSFYVTLRSDESNLRTGPGGEYPIKYTYNLKGMPLKVVGEYENWYKVFDKDNDEGWINKNLTLKKRNLIVIKGTQIAYKKNTIKSEPLFRLQQNVLLEYDKCTDDWCKIKINGKNCWIEKSSIWGY